VNRTLLLLLALPLGCRGTFDIGKYVTDESGTMSTDTQDTATSDASETRSDETDTNEATATTDDTDTDTDTNTTDTDTDTDTTDTDLMCAIGTLDLGTACIGLKYTVLTGASSPTDLALGDFDGDNVIDLLIPGAPVSYFVGGGGAMFGEQIPVAEAAGPRLATMDWNSDGRLDFMTITDTEIEILIADGNADFAPDVTFFNGGYDGVFGDFDGDLDDDLVLTGPTVRVFVRDANDLSELQNLGVSAEKVALADLNNDAHLDIALAMNAMGQVGVVLTDGAWGVQSLIPAPLQLAADVVVAHMDEEPTLELIAVGGNPGQLLLARVQDGALIELATYAVGNLPRAVAAGDIDGDSANDIAVGNASSHDVSLLMGSRGQLTNEYRLPVDDLSDHPESIAVADLDNDGRAEIIVGMIGSNRVLVYGHVQ
jgi:hypothetical protein